MASFVLLVLIAALAGLGIVGALVLTARDGLRRQPDREEGLARLRSR